MHNHNIVSERYFPLSEGEGVDCVLTCACGERFYGFGQEREASRKAKQAHDEHRAHWLDWVRKNHEREETWPAWSATLDWTPGVAAHPERRVRHGR